jgi:hypothetical protein
MKFKDYLNESDYIFESNSQSFLKSIIIPLVKMPYDKVVKLLKDKTKEFVKELKNNGLENEFLKIVNKHSKTSYKSLDEFLRLDENLNESFKDFWELFKVEGWMAISIFPTLQMWFEFDKLLTGMDFTDLNFKKIGVYGTF